MSAALNDPLHTISWSEGGEVRSARWRSENGQAVPKRVVVADDTLSADAAWRLACEGTAILWRGDYHNARQLLQAMGRRADRSRQQPRRSASGKGGRESSGTQSPASQPSAGSPADAFHRHRMAQAQRARILGLLLIPFEADARMPLRRAPDVHEAIHEAVRGVDEALLTAPFVISLRELLGLIGANEWRRKGVRVPALGSSIHPWHGVFSPLRGEYLDLIARLPLPAACTCDSRAFDIGTGSGVIAAVLARRGVRQLVATDLDPRALACARENLARLGLDAAVRLEQADLFPSGRAPLVVCNPPWVPAKPTSAVERAVYDPDSRMLRGFLGGLANHLDNGGEGWLILSDLAEHLGLRTRAQLLEWVDEAGLVVLGREDIRPRHGKVNDASDPLHAARSAELTSLWRLGAKN